MPRIVALGAALILLLATCFFGFATHSKVVGLTQENESLQNQVAAANQQAAKARADLNAAQAETAQARKDADDARGKLASVQTSLDSANAQVSTLNEQVTDLKKQIAAAPTPGQAPVQPAGPTQDEYDKAIADLKDKTSQLAELTEVKETLTNKLKDTESRVGDLQKVVDRYKGSVVRNGLEGEVLAVNQGWSFVVLSIGDRQGAVTNAEMILKRGDNQIGRVRITSVEPSTSVADIVPGSLARGVRVQPGDRVIFPGS